MKRDGTSIYCLNLHIIARIFYRYIGTLLARISWFRNMESQDAASVAESKQDQVIKTNGPRAVVLN
jgi:hypothetical protein